MTPLEVYGALFAFLVIGSVVLWVLASRAWGRRRIPERLIGVCVNDKDYGLSITKKGHAVLERTLARLEAKVRVGAVEEAELPDFDFDHPRHRPPSVVPFDHSPPRPWARG